MHKSTVYHSESELNKMCAYSSCAAVGIRVHKNKTVPKNEQHKSFIKGKYGGKERSKQLKSAQTECYIDLQHLEVDFIFFIYKKPLLISEKMPCT